ncbi:hypothetical protein NPX13_g9137 [Xylaria arbuscula]|uniref:Uncharacterized protein n=1 Tax=Xylaria arbuscula TaxID=114810 RepID=A0A9W8TJ67_9PEZI|nr:hypothetical protein NPX13_g9137 [Xylaria arbuscula]
MFARVASYDASEQYDHTMAKRPFHVHEDHYAVDTMSEEQERDERARSQTESQSQTQRADDDYYVHEDEPDDDDDADRGTIEDEENEEHDDADDNASESSDEDERIDLTVQQDMEKLQQTFPHFRDGYRLIKRIGEVVSLTVSLYFFPGTFSTVYKAEDLRYHDYVNRWDMDADEGQWTPPPLKSSATHSIPSSRPPRRRPKTFENTIPR